MVNQKCSWNIGGKKGSHTFQECSRAGTSRIRIGLGDSRQRLVVGSNAIYKASSDMVSPLDFNQAVPNQGQSKSVPQSLMAAHLNAVKQQSGLCACMME